MTRVFIGFLVVFAAVFLMAIRRPPIPSGPPIDNGYKGMNVAAPQLYGWKIKVYSFLYQIPVLSTLISSILFKTNHFDDVHALAYYSGATPTYEPLKLLSDSAYQRHVDYSHEHDYSKLLTSKKVRDSILGPIDNSQTKSLITVEAIHEAYVSKRITPLEFITQAIENAAKLNHLNIFIAFNTDDILKQAKESTERWKAGKQLSILDGVPIAVKDESDVIGYNTTYGTKFEGARKGPKTKDSELVRRIRALGAIIFGKTNMHELGIQPTGYNPHYGNAKNPYGASAIYDSGHGTGGSSSGSAAAVSSGLLPIALGADGGGSIRLPSSLTGVIGLKSTYGRVPSLPAVCCWSVVHAGLLSGTIRDQMIGYMAIAGIESDISALAPPKHFHLFKKINDLSDITIGVHWDWFAHAQPEVVEACWKVVDELREKYGAKIKNISIPHLGTIGHAHGITILSEFLTADLRIVNYQSEDPSHRYSPAAQAMLEFAKQFTATDFIAAQQIRTMTLDYFENKIFNKEKYGIDIIVTPTSSNAAHKYVEEASETGLFDAELISKQVRFMGLANLIGIPGISIPIGYTNIDGSGNILNDSSKLPIGLQLMSNHWNEHILFRVGSAVESLVEKELPPEQNRVVYNL